MIANLSINMCYTSNTFKYVFIYNVILFRTMTMHVSLYLHCIFQKYKSRQYGCATCSALMTPADRKL